ncbi:hypothetical protein BH10CYA1_BH10CYA1_29230 [soil metagenome]
MTHSDPTNFLTPEVPSSSDFHRDQILGGRYRVLSVLGRGGMGIVYKVEQIFLGKELALKTIEKSEQSDFTLRRFQTEARAVFSVNHPNIIAVHDFGLLDDQTPFMAMEIVIGKTLGEVLESHVLSIEEAVPLFIQVCFGLAHAHDNGVVHRDIKPNNIMILDGLPWGTEGSVKILDFGIAKLTQHEGGEIQALTRTGEIFGSPFYMSPEQCLAGKIDHRSDVYSLGCVLFETLTGRPPFTSDSALNTMMLHHTGAIPTLREASLGGDFPPALEQVVRTMLEKNPNARYQNLGLAAHDLAAITQANAASTSSIVSLPKSVKPAQAPNLVTMRRSHFGTLLVCIAATCSMLTVLATHVFQPVQPRKEAKPTTVNSDLADSGMQEAVKEAEQKQKKSAEQEAVIKPTVVSQEFEAKIKTRAIRFSADHNADDTTLAVFRNYNGVQSLDLENRAVTDAGFADLQNSKILTLFLRNCIGINTVKNISKIQTIQGLDLCQTKINDSAMPMLAKLPMLETLNLENCNVSKKGLEALARSTTLREVTLTKNRYSEPFIDNLRRKMPQCVFKNYYEDSALTEAQKKTRLTDTYQINEYLCSIAKEANPQNRMVSLYMLTMGQIRANENRLDEANQLVRIGTEISKRNDDRTTLAMALEVKAGLALLQKKLVVAVQLREQALKLYAQTLFHDDKQLLEKCLTAIQVAIVANQRPKAIDFGIEGLKFIDQFPDLNQDQLPVFCESIGWNYHCLAKPDKAKYYFQRNLKYWTDHRFNHPTNSEDPQDFYARALIELGNCEVDSKKKKALYDEALDLLDGRKYPETLNLIEHYCDACRELATLYESESNPDRAIKYLRRGLAVIKQMKHPDIFNRRAILENRLARYSGQKDPTRNSKG